MTKYWKKGEHILVATTGLSEVYVFLNESISTKDLNMEDFYIRENYESISRSEFHKAYKQTVAMINSAYSRLNMIETDELIPQATDQDKRDEEERFPVDDEHLHSEHLEFEL